MKRSPYKPTASQKHPACKTCHLYDAGCITPFMRGVYATHRNDAQPLILCVGEAPGDYEDSDGIPFHPESKSGKLLRKTLRKYLGTLDNIILTSAIRCHPPRNQATDKHQKCCADFVKEEINAVLPDLIIAFGAHAMTSVLGLKGVGKQRRKIHTVTTADGSREIPAVVCYSPSFVIRDQNQESVFAADVAFAASVLAEDMQIPQDSLADHDFLRNSTTYNATASDIRAFTNSVRKANQVISIDYETNSLKPWLVDQFYIRSVALSTGTQTIVVLIDENKVYLRNDHPKFMALLEILGDKTIRKVAHNVKYEMHCTRKRFGIELRGVASCTQVLHSFLYPISGMAHDLKSVASTYLGVGMYNDALHRQLELLREKRTDKAWDQFFKVDVHDAMQYNAMDAVCTIKIYHLLKKEMEREDVLHSKRKGFGYAPSYLFTKLLMPALHSLYRLERTGILIDRDCAEKLAIQFREDIEGICTHVRRMRVVREYEAARIRDLMQSDKAPKTDRGKASAITRMAFKPGSDEQVSGVIFEPDYFAFPDDGMARVKKGHVSVAADVLDRVAEEATPGSQIHDFVSNVLEYRDKKKSLSTYIEGSMEAACPHDGRIRCSFNQDRAATGRLSSSEPNLQNIKKTKEIKQMFRAKPGYVLVNADYSQIELRCVAAFSEDRDMLRVYRKNQDLHAETAMAVFDLDSPEMILPEQRTKAKGVNFGIVYLISPYGLSKQINTSVEEAELMISKFFNRFPGVLDWIERTKAYASKHGVVYTLFGRKREVRNCLMMPETDEEQRIKEAALRQAVNAPIQGTATDMCLCSLIELDRVIRKRKLPMRMVNAVHDSIMFEMRHSFVEEGIALAREIMTNEPVRWLGKDLRGVPIVVDFQTGPNWGELEDWHGK